MIELRMSEMRRRRKTEDPGTKPAFLAPYFVHRALPSSRTTASHPQNRSDADAYAMFPARKVSLRPSRKCRVANTQALASGPNARRTPAIIVVDHGSRRKEANDMLSKVGGMLQRKTDLPVYTAHMELASPSIADEVDKCVKEGATHIIVVPFFLSPGRHSTEDIPQMTANAVANHPGVTYDVRPPIGTHPGIIDVILDRAGLLGSVQK